MRHSSSVIGSSVAQLMTGSCLCSCCADVLWVGSYGQRSVTYDFLRYINILTYLLAYLLGEADVR